MFRVLMLPAEDGDCILIEVDGFRILIDCGRSAATAERVQSVLAAPANALAPNVDLVVVSHIDADHIGGILKLLSRNDAPHVGQIWFNGLNQLSQAEMSDRQTVEPPVTRARGREAALGVKHAAHLSELIQTRGHGWNTDFEAGPIMVDGALPRIAVSANSSITILGPPRAKLAAAHCHWKAIWKEFQRDLTGRNEPALGRSRRPRVVPNPDNIAALAADLDVADHAIANGTSISFVVECGGRRALFTADGHPDDLSAALSLYEPSGTPIVFDLIKVSHHGSARNTTSEFLSRASSPLYLISTDGSRHQHPDPQSMARIAMSPSPKRIAFNYRSSANMVWEHEDLRRHCGYETTYGDGAAPLLFELG